MSFDDEERAGMTSLERLSRRAFLARAGAAGVATATATVAAPMAAAAMVQAPQAEQAAQTVVPGTVPVTLRVNGTTHAIQVDPRATVLDTLRETLQLTGTKKGCDHGQCGACTIHVDGQRMNSCLLFAAMQQGRQITTIEGLGTPDAMHPLQASFVEHDAYQCGYCTSGQIMSAATLVRERCGASDSDVKESLSGNICRCGAYPNIVAAVQAWRRNATA